MIAADCSAEKRTIALILHDRIFQYKSELTEQRNLFKTHPARWASLLTALPATFMSAVSMTYILMAPEGFRLGAGIAYPVGIGFAAALFALYLRMGSRTASQSVS